MKGTGEGGVHAKDEGKTREEMRASAILRDGEHKKRRQRERENRAAVPAHYP